MRSVCFAACACLGVWGTPSVWSAPGDRQSVIDQQQQLVKDQEVEDLQRPPIEAFVKKYEPLQSQYGEISGVQNALRIGKDRLSQLDRARAARAASFWGLMDIKVPLQQPLDDSQLAELEAFIGLFGKSSSGQSASKVLDEHKRLNQASIAEMRLAKLQLKSTGEELSKEQLSELIEIEKEYPTTNSAIVAKGYIRAYISQTSRKEAGNIGLLVPENNEQFASHRLTEAGRLYGKQRDASRLRWTLAEIVEDYPDTLAGQQAKTQLAEVQKLLAVQAEHSRSIRNYWDAVYPSRISK